jgi:hypothetical protein
MAIPADVLFILKIVYFGFTSQDVRKLPSNILNVESCHG